MTGLVIRPLTAGEEHCSTLPDPGLAGRALLGQAYNDLAAQGEYGPS